MPELSIVSPVYKAEKIVELLIVEIQRHVELLGITYEIILVDDRSPDNSWELIKKIAFYNTQIKSIRLSRNFGQHAAIMAGLSVAAGNWVVVMDCDLQDRPAEIPNLYKKAMEGYDVVMARRTVRNDHPIKKAGSFVFSIIFNFLSDVKINREVANYGIYNRKIILSILKIGDYVKAFPLFVYYAGFNATTITVAHNNRVSGKSSYNLKQLINLAFKGISAYSNKPLKILMKIGIMICILASCAAMKFLYGTGISSGSIVKPIIITIAFFSGLIICAIGIVGAYMGRIYEQVKGRPSYIIYEMIN